MSQFIFTPTRQFPNCPTHGQHEKWIWSEMIGTGSHGISHHFKLCGLCAIDMLRNAGYTVTEPENQTLKESDWILDELPEVKK